MNCGPSPLQDKLASLDEQLAAAKSKKGQLERDVQECEAKLGRAQQLISGLGGEKTRWTAVAQESGEQLVKLTGDVLLGVGAIAYLGAFTAGFRSEITKECVRTPSREKGICDRARDVRMGEVWFPTPGLERVRGIDICGIKMIRQECAFFRRHGRTSLPIAV